MEKLNMRPIQVPLHLSLDQRCAFVKRMVESQKDKKMAIFEISDEQWFYDEDGAWASLEETEIGRAHV